MQSIITAVLLIGGLGLIAGLILAVASVLMAVPKDEKAEALLDVLPGANCGACGYSGCAGYAKAMAHDGAAVGLCSPGGAEVAAATARLLGMEETGVVHKTAVVRCGGCEEFTSRKLDYHGIPSCRAAAQFFGGDWLCNYGCLGYGDCAAACDYGAITVKDGLATVDPTVCRGCTQCVSACPKGLIALFDSGVRGVVCCSSHDKGAVTRAACKVGCIGCGKCAKVCPHGAIAVTDSLAVIDPDKCVGCGVCAENCPAHCITISMPAENEAPIS